MRIVISGAGGLSVYLVEMLMHTDHDITIIDNDKEALDNIYENIDALKLLKNPLSIEDLKGLGLNKCDLFVAISPDTKTNILSSSLAKTLGAKKCIARVNNHEYMLQESKDIFASMGVDHLFNLEKLASREILSLLKASSTTQFVSFANGLLALVVFKIDETSTIVGKSMMELSKDLTHSHYRTVALQRGDVVIIPRGTDVFMVGDEVHAIVLEGYLDEMLSFSGKKNVDLRNVMIAGGGSISERVALKLEGFEKNVRVKIIEKNDHKAKLLSGRLDKALVIVGDVRNSDCLREEGLKEQDVFIALTGNSETNILSGLFAKKMGVEKVIVEVENTDYISLAESMGLDTIINIRQLGAGRIFKFTQNLDLQSFYLANSNLEVLEFVIKPNSRITKNKVAALDFPKGALIGGLIRDDKGYLVTGETVVNAEDRVVVFTLLQSMNKVIEFFK